MNDDLRDALVRRAALELAEGLRLLAAWWLDEATEHFARAAILQDAVRGHDG